MESTKIKPDFEDTEKAFAHKSDKALRRTFRLFKKIDSPFLTKIGPPLIAFALKIGLPVKGIIKRTLFDIFCGGTSLKNIKPRVIELHENGVQTILDYAVEGEKSEAGFDATAEEIRRTLLFGAKEEAIAFTALKITGIADTDLLEKTQRGQELSNRETSKLQAAKERLTSLCDLASQLSQPLFIDAEESWIQDTIDQWAEEMMLRCNKQKPIIYTTIQFYRINRVSYLQYLIEKGRKNNFIPGIKLVRGAYLEKERERAEERGYPDPIQANKAQTDQDFNTALRICIEAIEAVAICAGTHNEESSYLLTSLMHEKGLVNHHAHVLFAQLLGMSDHISYNLSYHRYNTAKYLPYGPVKKVMPYLFRRAKENTAIAGQSGRELSLLRKEMKRRKLL